MTARTAVRRLFVACVALLTAVVSLLAALTRLVAGCVAWLAGRVPTGVPVAPRDAVSWGAKPANVRAQRPRLALVPQGAGPRPLTQAQRLESALTGLGYRGGEVRQFVAGVGPRVEREQLPALIKEGLAALSPAVAL